MKRKLSLLMVLMMIVSMVPMSAFAAEPTQLKSDAADALGFAGETVIEVTVATEGGITYEVGSTITFDSRDEIKGDAPDGTVVSGNVVTITDPDEAPFTFEVELGEETGLRQLTIRGANGRVVRRFYAEVLTSGKSGAEVLQTKRNVTRSQSNATLATFVVRGPGKTDGANNDVILTLPRDFEWTTGTKINGDNVLDARISENKRVLSYELPAGVNNISVQPVVNVLRNASFGDVAVEIESKEVETDVVVAEVVDYKVTVKVDKEKNILAGKDAEVKIILDGVAGAFTNRDIEFVLDGAKVKGGVTVTAKGVTGGGVVASDAKFVELSKDKDEFFVRAQSNLDKMNKIELEFTVVADLDATGGDMTLTVEGGGVDKQTVTLGEVKPIATFETRVQDIRVTNVATKTADIVITESQAGALQEATTAHVIAFRGTDAPRIVAAKVEVDGNIEVDVEVKDGQILLTVERASRREGSVITIKDIEVTVPRATLPGKYDLRLSAEGKDKVAQWTYVNVLEPGALVRKTTVFTLDSAVFTVDGEQMMLDAAPYISNNRTMLPIGTMAQLLGATVNYSPATRTAVFSRDNLVVSMNLDTNVLLVNGVPVMMDAKPEIKNDRAFVPVVFVAQAFGVQNGVDIVFDAATRTVTLFPNN